MLTLINYRIRSGVINMLIKPFTDSELIDIIFTQLKLGNLTQQSADNMINTTIALLP